jgi:hypothetical protein
MMATDMRKPLPETIDDLKKMNFTVIDPYFKIDQSYYKYIEEERR